MHVGEAREECAGNQREDEDNRVERGVERQKKGGI
jgi:hypothetical protein